MEAGLTARKESYAVLYFVSLNHFMNDGSTALFSSLLPAAIALFDFSKLEVGILVAAGYLVNMIFQPLTGRYSEKFEARVLLALGISLLGLAMIMFALSGTFLLMLISILVLRFGSSFFHPVGVSAVSRSYTGRTLDRVIGIQSAFGNLGILMVFLVSAPIYLGLGWRGPFLIYAAMDLTVVVVTLLLYSRSRNSSPAKTEGEEVSTTGKSAGVSEEKKSRMGLPLFFLFVTFISGGSFAVFQNYGNILLNQNGFNLSISDYLVASWVMTGFFGAISTGLLTKRFSRKRLLPISLLITSISTLTFVIFQGSALIIVFSLMVSGFFLAVTYPALYSELAAYLGENSKREGPSFGILFSSQIGGASIMGFASGYIAQVFGLNLPFEIVSAMLAVAFIFSYSWTRIYGDYETTATLKK